MEGKRESNLRSQPDPYSGFFVFCGGDFRGVWLSGTATPKRSTEIYLVVFFSFSGGWNWDWLGNVPFFPLEKVRPTNVHSN